MIIANSLVSGFAGSNAMGQGLVLLQLLGSVIMVATIAGKFKELSFIRSATQRFMRDFTAGQDVLEYYIQRRPSAKTGLEGIYRVTSERLLRTVGPSARELVARDTSGASLTAREVELVRGTCEHALDEEEQRVRHGMGVIATIVALEPMLGLLGTVWGVLDAFAEMGSAGSANLATIAPSISAALVTTVVGLIIAIPGVIAFNSLTAFSNGIQSDMEGFVDELMGRVACEYQGRAV